MTLNIGFFFRKVRSILSVRHPCATRRIQTGDGPALKGTLRLALAGCLALVPSTVIAQPGPHPLLVLAKTTEPPKIDGVLDEPIWDQATRLPPFVMQLPREGIPSSESTDVRILYDAENLYLGITCFDSNPSAILTSSLARDDFAVSFGEQIAFAIDSTNSGRDGFWFSTNPGGAQLDSQLFDEGRVFDTEWDGVWESVAHVHDQGWTVEIKLPFFNLRFHEAPSNTMRLNFFRAIRHKNEDAYSPPIPRNYAGTPSFSIGRPILLEGIRRGHVLGVKPFGLINSTAERGENSDNDTLGEAGLDVKWAATTSVTADFTLNSDFAQVEADDRQVNLNRFPLFFPEKREFFLESAGLFTFGVPGQTEAFFSRRIGLDSEGRAVPILAGARLTGRRDKWSFGALDVVADEAPDSRRTNFTVGRVRRDVGKRSSVGAIVTEREEQGPGGGNRLGGLDTRIVLGEDHFLDAFAMASRASEGEDAGNAVNAAYNHQGDRWRYGASAGWIDDQFQPGVGFVQRVGVQETSGYLSFRPRPEMDRIRQFVFSIDGSYKESRDGNADLDGQIAERTWHLNHQTEFESGDRMGGFYQQRFERVTESFCLSECQSDDLSEQILVPPGDYQNNSAEVNFNTWIARPLSFFGFFNYGPFFDGRRRSVGAGVDTRFGPHFSISTQYTLHRIELPGGDFDTNLWITRLNYAFSPLLFGGALIQWNDVSDDFDLNLRLDFIHTPGSDLFLVYNQSFNTHRAEGEPPSNGRAGILKLTYLFQF